MKEDILEQIVEGYLQTEGYFTLHNVKYRPSVNHVDYVKKEDCVHSDIDVLGFNPLKRGCERVMAVSCKSYQDGFGVKGFQNLLAIRPHKKVGNKPAWKHFRELVVPKWSDAFVSTVKVLTGADKFTYVTAITAIKEDRKEWVKLKKKWESSKQFKTAMHGNKIRLLTLTEMVSAISSHTRKTLAPSDFGRTIQLLKAAGYSFETPDLG